jgi:hypothetical protein
MHSAVYEGVCAELFIFVQCTIVRNIISYRSQVSDKFGICTVVDLNGALVEAKMFTVTLECMHFIFNMCPI